MKPLLMTLYEGDYHYGVAALVNSAVRRGFDGRVCVFHRGGLPPWTAGLERLEENRFAVEGVTLDFRPAQSLRHLGYHKPFAALEALRLYDDCGSVVYADPDVVFLAPWSFFETWLAQGVAICLDANFPFLSEDHPWRAEWRRLLAAAGLSPRPGAPYANSGFFGLRREDRGFLEAWTRVTRAFEAEGGDTASFHMAERHRAVVGDQDLMAAALMAWEGARSTLGPEGMGFNRYYFILSHDIGSPKPWSRPFLRQALGGVPPSRSAALFFDHCNAPIRAWPPGLLARRKAALKAAQLLSRVWKR